MQRLRNFEPNLKEMVLVASTASQDIGIFTKSDKPLSSDVPPERQQNLFTMTSLANDARRAQMPMTEDMTSDTSPVGMALDLSSTSNVFTPIPGHEMEQSKGPLPALLILNNEGLLCGWWIVYNDSVTQGLTYSSLVAAQGQQAQPVGQSTPSAFRSATMTSPQASQPAFGQSSLGNNSSAPPFASVNQNPAFGSTSTPAAAPGLFGGGSNLGSKPSPWGGSATAPTTGGSAFGQPAFGSASTMGSGAKPAFGSSGGLGITSSPWGATTTSSPTTTSGIFGQPGLGAQKPAAFGSAGPTTPAFSNTSTASTSGGFASFATSGGFASAAATATANTEGGSIFGKSAPANTLGSAFSKDTSMTSTPKKDEGGNTGLFGAPKEGFSLRSAWKSPDAGKEAEKPAQGAAFGSQGGGSFFGSDLGKAIGEASQTTPAPVSEEAEMTSDTEDSTKRQSSEVKPAETTTPADTPAAPKFFSAPPASGGLFGTQSQSKTTLAAVQKSEPAPFSWGKPQDAAQTPKADIPVIKEEPKDQGEQSKVGEDIPEAPLPPDTTSKTSYTPGTSSNSSTGASKTSADEAPLPPDFLKPSSKPKAQFEFDDPPLPPNFAPSMTKNKPATSPTENPFPPNVPSSETQPQVAKETAYESQPLPEGDDEGLDDEGSGVDVAQELSPTTDQSPKVTPESSFGQKHDKSSLGGSFTKVGDPQAKPPSKPLFGELGTSPATFFPPPSRTQQSPRSPSPIRKPLGGDLLRPDNTRSVSAPGMPLRADTFRKVTLGRPAPDNAIYPPQNSVERQQREERERKARQKAKAQAEEELELSDDEDENIRFELNSEIEVLRELGEFQAHEDYAGKVNKPGIPGQIEKVYRDINAMVDVLGLNSRRLQGWIKGQEELMPDQGRDRDDLDKPEDWCLGEVFNLGSLQADLEAELAQGRLTNVSDNLSMCHKLSKEVDKLKVKRSGISKIIKAQNDPETQESLKLAPLSPEQASLCQDLRNSYTEFQKTLSEAEQSLSVLQAKLVTYGAANSKPNGYQKVPTVEAVEKTILKMTGMVEKKSGDIDFLETQMRKLGVRGDTSTSREGSPFVTPPTSARNSKTVMRTPKSSVNGNAFYTPQSRRSRFANSIGSNFSEMGRSPKKKMSEVSQNEAAAYAARASLKKQMHSLLKEALVSSEVRIRPLDN